MARSGFLTAPSAQTAFVLRAIAWSLGLFGLLRLTFVEQSLIVALLQMQGAVVHWYFASEASSVTITSSCSAADVMAMCLGVVLAYPAPWKRRLTGAALGVVLIVALNIVRIATLAVLAARWPAAFGPVHLLGWPVLLAAATTTYVWQWIRRVSPVRPLDRVAPARGGSPARRFAWTAAGLLALHLALAPWTMTSTTLTVVGRWTASSARIVLTNAGIPAASEGPRLVTSRGTFEITPECLLTPVFPLYLAAALSLPMRRRRRLAALLAAIPIFLILGVVRVLVLAVPAWTIASPLFLVHGFFQIVVGLAIVVWTCRPLRQAGAARLADWPRVAGAILAGGVAAAIGAPWLTRAAFGVVALLRPWAPHAVSALVIPGDLQGALVLAPLYQLGLLTAIWVGRRPITGASRYALALAALLLSMVAGLVMVGAWIAHAGAAPHALVLRAWSVGAPLFIAWVFFRTPSADTKAGDPVYREFWAEVGAGFPDLGGAWSTALYAANERALVAGAVTPLTGARVLKTDLWDEAKNTRIAQWMAGQGAHVYGIDISPATLRQARAEFGAAPAHLAIADVRAVPFASGSFDAIYSMGTVEHFEETEAAVIELARLLKPGGRLILGVPNKHDPFLRPLFVGVLQRLGAYGYGSEKCYSRAELRAMLEGAGLTVTLESGLLFIPGYLRMFDLLLHTRWPRLSFLSRPLVRVFMWIDQRMPTLRRHGYLLASVGVKPAV